MGIDVEELRAYLLDYYGTAAFGGFPFAVMDVCDIEGMDAFELCRKAEQMGVDLKNFEA